MTIRAETRPSRTSWIDRSSDSGSEPERERQAGLRIQIDRQDPLAELRQRRGKRRHGRRLRHATLLIGDGVSPTVRHVSPASRRAIVVSRALHTAPTPRAQATGSLPAVPAPRNPRILYPDRPVDERPPLDGPGPRNCARKGLRSLG